MSIFAKVGLLLVVATLVTATFIAVANKVIIDKAVQEGVYSLGANVTGSVAAQRRGDPIWRQRKAGHRPAERY